MGNLRDRPRSAAKAVALVASSTKWQEGIECCREPGDLRGPQGTSGGLEEVGPGFYGPGK